MSGRRSFLKASFGLGILTLSLMGCAKSGDRANDELNAPKTMTLESPAFTANSEIPVQYTCNGVNISPPLQWSDPPAETRSLTLIVTDPDAPGDIFTHWVLYDLPAETRQLPEKVANQPFLLDGGVNGKNDFDEYGYGAPCPPSGTHRYIFRLYALDTTLNLAPGVTKTEVVAAMQGHVLAGAELIGRYTQPE